MANVLTTAAKQAMLAAYTSGKSFKVVLVDDADYTYSAAHDYLDDIPSAARVATSPALTGVTTTNGVFDSADVSITGVTGDTVERAVLIHDSGSAATSTIICQYDSASGLVLTPNGGTVNITVHGSGWFSL